MWEPLLLLALLALGSLIFTPIIAFHAHGRITKLESRVLDLKKRLDGRADREAAAGQAQKKPAPSPEQAKPATPPDTAQAPTSSPEPGPTPTPAQAPESTEQPEAKVPTPVQNTEKAEADAPKAPRKDSNAFTRDDTRNAAMAAHRAEAAAKTRAEEASDKERNFATKWLVWLGGLTVALGGVFLVKYSIDHGLLSPAIRIAAGLTLSIALIIGGEWVRRKSAFLEQTATRPDFVPQALTGAGVAIAFGSIYAGYGLYGLLSPLVAFVTLALVCAAALALSLLQGHFVAVLGVAGGFAIPMLIQTDTPSAWVLFVYLTFVAGAAFWIVRYKDWWWLAATALLGSAAWQFLWIGHGSGVDGPLPLYMNMLAVFAMALGMRAGHTFAAPRRRSAHPFDLKMLEANHAFAHIAAVTLAAMSFVALLDASHSNTALIFTGVVIAVLGACAYRARALEAVFPFSALLATAGLLTWVTPQQAVYAGLSLFDNANLAELAQVEFTPEFRIFALAAGVTAGWFAVLGFIGMLRQSRKDLWAGLSAMVPLAALLLAYAKLSTLLPETVWAGIAMGLATAAIGAVHLCMPRRSEPFMEAAIGLYALAALSAIGVSLTMLLDGSWLTVALSAMILASAWVNKRFDVPFLRAACALVAGIVLGRLMLLNMVPFLSVLPEDSALWILYSYGLPALAFAFAARLFRMQKDDYLVGILESGAIAFVTATVNLEIREYFGDVLDLHTDLTLTEVSLHSLSWMLTGTALYYRDALRPRKVHRAASRISLGMAGVTVAGAHILLLNPFVGETVEGVPVFNTLLPAYLAPALCAAILAYLGGRFGKARFAGLAAITAAAMAFLWVNMEIRHVFHGARLDLGPTTDMELYTYSIVWLVCAAPVLIVGLLRDLPAVRRVGLGLVLLTVAKVFIIDMSDLDGLYRVLSFLGLGFSLIGIGFLYQRTFK